MASKNNDRQWDAVIRPRSGWFDIDLRELAHYRDLILLLVKRNVTVLYKQTVLGPAWMVIQPVLSSLMFTVVFGGIAALPTDGMPDFLFYMAGNIVWAYFSNALKQCSTVFVDNHNLFGKVYFPRMVMPISLVMSKLINFFVQFALFAVFLVYYAVMPNSPVQPNWRMIVFVPLVLLQTGMLAMGLGSIISSLTTRYRDLTLLVNLGITLWMYATPIAYPASMVMENYPALVGLYMLNPVTPIVEFFRAAFLGVETFSLAYMPLSVGMTLALFALGILMFSRIEKTFMDTV
ncbi:MAG TPA: ABC transporter permease [Candidatus Pullichristensenella avicola]|nr:ABC transporter permease [Candidatus Pullichristensenella avicola]